MLTEVALCLTFPLAMQSHPIAINLRRFDPACPK